MSVNHTGSILRDVDFHQVDPEVQVALEELARKEWLAESLKAQIEQEQFARHCRDLKSIDGMGGIERAIHNFAYHDWAFKLGSYDCWKDAGFLRYFDRIAPEARVKSKGTRTQVGYTRPLIEPVRRGAVRDANGQKVVAE